jgi:ABC-type glycerol-3-phosphate transport system substrate-binding protein
MKGFKTIVIAGLLLTGAGILAFGPRAGAKAPAGRVRVQYWEKWTGNEGSQMQEVVRDFNETVGKEKGIFVEYLSMSQIDRKTLVATAAGVPPDVAGMWDAQTAQFAGIDALEPLDEMAREKGITRDYYKHAYWDACTYNGKLYGLVSTPSSIALHYNKEIIEGKADELRKAGFDPDVPPKTMQELDKRAEVLDTWVEDGGRRYLKVTGLLPIEPDWYLTSLPFWWGAEFFDGKTQKLNLTDPQCIAAYEWTASYSKRLGKVAMTEFKAGFGGFNSPQNPFLQGEIAMEMQGPWMANYIEDLRPSMNRWRVPEEKQARERNFSKLDVGMTRGEVEDVLGRGEKSGGDGVVWDAGIRTITVRFDEGGRVSGKRMELLPAKERRKYTQWGVAPFPSAVPGLENAAHVGFDVLCIPKGSKLKKEAFEFIAYVNRQEVMEKLCMLHCKNSPLAQVSENFKTNHPNPYIEVFDTLAASPNARTVPSCPIWPEVAAELTVAAQKTYLLQKTAAEALAEVDGRMQGRWARFRELQKARGNTAMAEAAGAAGAGDGAGRGAGEMAGTGAAR